MEEATAALLIMSLLIFAIFLGFLVWGIRSKQFKNIEEAKYRIFLKPGKNAEKTQEKPGRKEDDQPC
jgi:nitrogen fixation-related uncharacterized protein